MMPKAKKTAKKATKKSVKKASFNNENDVLYEVAQDLGLDPDELSIKEESSLSSFGAGTVYEISQGHQEWMVVKNSDQEHELALEVVKQDLEQEPEIFSQDWLQNHIDMDRLRRDLHSDVYDSTFDRLNDDAERNPDDFWREYEREGFSAPEEDEDGERPEPEDLQVEELAEKQTQEQLKDPMGYLEDIDGKEEAVKQAIKIAGIDINAAAEDAVGTDGPEHFLAHYDGTSHETKSGFVYWRAN
jgi:hypothetical protein